MIEIEKPEWVLRYKHCDSCGSEEGIVAINITNETTKIGTTVCICRDCAKLLGVGLLRIADGKEKL